MTIEGSSTGWFLAGVSTVVATLASAVAFLFRMNESKNAAAILTMQSRLDQQEQKLVESDEKHDQCQRDREQLSVQVATLNGKLDRYIIDQKDLRTSKPEEPHE